MEDIILKVDRLVKKYDDFTLQDFSLELPRGYIMGFLGRNGAGKSTTIKCIMDLIQYNHGSIVVRL